MLPVRTDTRRRRGSGEPPVRQHFQIDHRFSAGNLHVTLTGAFSDMCAWELAKVIRKQPVGVGRVFVNTAGIEEIDPEGVRLLKCHMADRRLPRDWLYFKGEKGFVIAPDLSRVLVCKKQEKRKRPPLKILTFSAAH